MNFTRKILSQHSSRHLLVLLFPLILLFVFSTSVFPGENGRMTAAHGVFRINTNVSAGSESIDEISAKASAAKLDFIVVSDQFLVVAKYGMPPFRNIIKAKKEQKSVISFGVAKYLEMLDNADKKNRKLLVIPGFDVAPYYYWTGNYFGGNLVNHQFSQQLTVFGDVTEKFAKNMPVIHNCTVETRPLMVLLKLLPLLFLIIPFIICRSQTPYYSDAQGNKYYSYRHPLLRKIILIVIVIISLLWTINNRPFTRELGMDPYGRNGENNELVACQKLIDYVNTQTKNNNNLGVFWSVPEAKTVNSINSVKLVTNPYLDDVTATCGHNGFGAIYGDHRVAHLPGGAWDLMLDEYCSGKRKIVPVTMGEGDYHGPPTAIDFIKTVVFLDSTEINREKIVKAIISGSSYSVTRQNGMEAVIDDYYILTPSGKKIFSGGTVSANSVAGMKIVIKGYCKMDGPGRVANGKITVVCNGAEMSAKFAGLKEFSLEMDVPEDVLKDRNIGYVRFFITSSSGLGELISNPIFIKRK